MPPTHVDHPDLLELTLGSVGALLDEHQAQDVLVVQGDGGYIVRAMGTPAPAMPPGTMRVPLERSFDPVPAPERPAAVPAGPIERALRAIGRRAVAGRLSDITVASLEDGSWIVWHRRVDGSIGSTVLDPASLEKTQPALTR